MPLKYADVCKICQTRRTQHATGICSQCRRQKGKVMCKICADVETSHPSGICYACRKRGIHSDEISARRIDAAIEDIKVTLFILQQRKEKTSFAAIAEMCGMSKSNCYTRFMEAVGRSAMSVALDIEDGSYIYTDANLERELATPPNPGRTKSPPAGEA